MEHIGVKKRTTAMYGEVWYNNCNASQFNDFWYVLVKICANTVANTAQTAMTTEKIVWGKILQGLRSDKLTESKQIQVDFINSSICYTKDDGNQC